MADTSIEWTDVSWNVLRGCSRVSAGCENCYAEGVARRFSGPGMPYEGLVRIKDGKAKAQWNGTVRFVAERLADPLTWRKPKRVFVNSMSDLFHDGVSFEQIAAIFGVMAAAPQHTFQVLTKRPERAKAFFEWLIGQGDELRDIIGEDPESGTALPSVCAMSVGGLLSPPVPSDIALGGNGWRAAMKAKWPLANVWLGVSVEDQASADKRIPHLLACPAAVRWVSHEPALEAVDFDAIQCPGEREGLRFSALRRMHDDRFGSSDVTLDWVVIGGESGPGARPFDLLWARSVIAQCAEAGTAAFFKQAGALPFLDGRRLRLLDRKGATLSELPVEFTVREFPDAT